MGERQRGDVMRVGPSNDIDATAASIAAVGQPALFGCDASGSITFADPAIGQLLGVDPATLIGTRRVSDLLDASELAARAETLGVPVGPECLLTVPLVDGRESRVWTLIDVD